MFGNYVGSFVKVDKGLSENRPRSFLRLQANVDISKSLKSRVFIKNDDGSTQWLAFKHERLSDFCFGCGKLGHVVVGCSAKSAGGTNLLELVFWILAWLLGPR